MRHEGPREQQAMTGKHLQPSVIGLWKRRQLSGTHDVYANNFDRAPDLSKKEGISSFKSDDARWLRKIGWDDGPDVVAVRPSRGDEQGKIIVGDVTSSRKSSAKQPRKASELSHQEKTEWYGRHVKHNRPEELSDYKVYVQEIHYGEQRDTITVTPLKEIK